jgi:hypothetical protein
LKCLRRSGFAGQAGQKNQGLIELPSVADPSFVGTCLLTDQKVMNIYVLFARHKDWRICDLIKKDQKIKARLKFD